MPEDYLDKNIGELADSALGDLAGPREQLEMSTPEGPYHEADLERAIMKIKRAQRKVSEIRRRHEESAGPIGSYEENNSE